MQANRSLTQLIEPNPAKAGKSSWMRAYLRFLFSKDESTMLKIAPLALMGILPIDILSNIVPVVGELDDLGFIVLLAIVAVRTSNRVRKYR